MEKLPLNRTFSSATTLFQFNFFSLTLFIDETNGFWRRNLSSGLEKTVISYHELQEFDLFSMKRTDCFHQDYSKPGFDKHQFIRLVSSNLQTY